MARFNSRWRMQPRDMNGRFTSSGGGGEQDPMNEWFLKAPWWQKVLALAAMVAVCLLVYYSGYVLVFIIGCWVVVFVMRVIRALVNGGK